MKEIISLLIILVLILILIIFILKEIFNFKILPFSINLTKSKNIENIPTIENKSINKEQKNETNIESLTNRSLGSSMRRENVSDENYLKIPELKIVDLCPPYYQEETRITEGGGVACINYPSPYTITLRYFNSSYIEVNIDNKIFYSNGTKLFFILIEGINVVGNEIQNIYFEGSNNYYLGNYTIYETIINNEVYSISTSIPFYLKENFVSEDLKLIKFFATISNSTYFVGEFYIRIF